MLEQDQLENQPQEQIVEMTSGKQPWEKPELKELDVTQTASGTSPATIEGTSGTHTYFPASP
ncbi:MAG: hypothetical protein H3C34_20675 [Caldilineaceae bacterium]|nr:hypothetical protein [Caldilineaceae bacterium]